ncbi:hypothetical protein P7C73_g2342, partial [Tremellales sp. Uapishka_1]
MSSTDNKTDTTASERQLAPGESSRALTKWSGTSSEQPEGGSEHSLRIANTLVFIYGNQSGDEEMGFLHDEEATPSQPIEYIRIHDDRTGNRTTTFLNGYVYFDDVKQQQLKKSQLSDKERSRINKGDRCGIVTGIMKYGAAGFPPGVTNGEEADA